MIRFCLCLLLSTAFLLAQDSSMDDLSAGTALGGPQVLETIKNADKVTAQRVDSPKEGLTIISGKRPKLQILGAPLTISGPQATELKQAFSRGSTYLSPSKNCEFRPNVLYGFTKGSETYELVLCFGCGELEAWKGESLVSFGPFDGGYGTLLAITKAIYPDDRFFDQFSEASHKERAARLQIDPPVKP